MPEIFLAVSALGALLTWNAHYPRPAGTYLGLPSFIFGWLTAELAVHHVAWQVVATGVFVAFGALEAWPGWMGLGLSITSWWGMFRLLAPAERTADVVEDALLEGLGDSYATELARWPLEPEPPRYRLTVPFLLSDPGVKVDQHIRYAEGHGRRRLLDLYTPREGAENAPVLLQIHGGAWSIGEKREQAKPLMNHLASRGWVCVAVNYRLSPQHKFPAHLLDLKLAIRWIRENIAHYGGDPEFLAATGGSAGGHLSALVALTANDPEYQEGFEHVDTSVRACVPFYGIYDFANDLGHPEWQGIVDFLGSRVFERSFEADPDAFRKASPVARIRHDAPPFLVIHGADDSLAPVIEGRAFSRVLRERSQQPVVYAEIPGAQHAFEVFHSLRTHNVIHGVDRFLAHVYADYATRGAGPVLLS